MELEKPLAFSRLAKLIPLRAAMPESVSPDFTVYDVADDEEDDDEEDDDEEADDDEADELDDALLLEDEELLESFRLWPG